MTAFFKKRNKIHFCRKVLFTYKIIQFQDVTIKFINFLEHFGTSSMCQALLSSHQCYDRSSYKKLED